MNNIINLKPSTLPKWLGWSSLLVVVLFFHLWQIETLPRGLYVDESSIGLNAASIATNLRDEHDVFLPVYFEAFGEYKNPLYIYSASILFALFDVSDLALRATSFVYFALFLTGLIFLVRQIFPQNKLVLFYGIASASFLPWLFSISRVSFEVITQPATIVWAVYFIYRGYADSNATRRSHLFALSAGLIIGLSFYAYSTSRLLSPLLLISVVLLYLNRAYWRRHLYLIFGATTTLLPYLIFNLQQPSALMYRFTTLTYVFDASLSLLDKSLQFITNYFSYFSLEFLILNGDSNLRHHTGFGGQLQVIVFILFIIGVWALVAKIARSCSDRRFELLLVLNLIIAPVAAALTEPVHSLRSVMLGMLILLVSLYGFATVQQIRQIHLRYLAISTLIIALIAQSALYLHHYFSDYPSQSIHAFESYGFKQTLTTAILADPLDIVVSKYANQPYAHLEYYRYQLPLPESSSVSDPVASPGRCIIYFPGGESHLNDSSLGLIRSINSTYTKLRCYNYAESH